MSEESIVALDIGTTKVAAAIAEVKEEEIEIIGVGSAPSKGLKKGTVVNLDSTIRAIEQAISEAELMAGVTQIRSVYASIGGSHIQGLNSHGVIAVTRGREISKQDVERAIEAAQAIAIPADREVVHILPQQFIIDGQSGIKDPVGMSGVRLEVEAHIVTGASSAIANITKSINRAGFAVEELVLAPFAAAYAVLNDGEKELGTILVDIGGGTSDILMFMDGSLWFTHILDIGGENVTKDISVGLRTPLNEAERLKVEYGCTSTNSEGEEVNVPSVGLKKSRTVPRGVLAEIIGPRIEEIFLLINREIRMSGYENHIGGGVVLTGGSAQLEGVGELAEKVFGMPVRIGVPKGVGGLLDMVSAPEYAVVVGLLHYATKHKEGKKPSLMQLGIFKEAARRVKEWFLDLF